MPALSFQGEWLRKLLSGTKQQTTRPLTDRIKVGDICNIYNQQRRRIADKPMRKMTAIGMEMVLQKRTIHHDIRTYPPVHPDSWIRGLYYAHFLGKVEITEVYDLYPYDAPLDSVLADWAHADGFDTFEDADVWFMKRYGEEWDLMHWTVIRWDGWTERYFEPEAIR